VAWRVALTVAARPPLLVLLCVTFFTVTFSIGAFPPLLPELGASARLSDRELGMVASAYGFARMVAAVPVGILVTRYLSWTLLAAPAVLASGIVLLSLAQSLEGFVLGRVVMGIGQSAVMIGGLTALLRYSAGVRLASALNAVELSAMVGMLGGVTLLGLLPRTFGWNLALLAVCSPIVLGIALAPLVSTSVPREPRGATVTPAGAPSSSGSRAARPLTGLAVLAFVAGGCVAVSYSTIEQFLIPMRGAREFGLDRVGISRLFMLMQISDILTLVPAGMLADRLGPQRVLGAVLLTMAAGGSLIALGSLPLLGLGCALFGLGMAGWMLPLGVLRAESSPEQIGWRTAVYRVGVDGGMFLGPFLSGLLGAERAGVLPLVMAVALAVIGGLLIAGWPTRAGRQWA
jgi:predicted MFS family arabinose efflux permease